MAMRKEQEEEEEEEEGMRGGARGGGIRKRTEIGPSSKGKRMRE